MGRGPVRIAVRIHQAGMSFGELAAIWREADRLGYHGASLYDLITAPAHECWTALTALTVATRGIRPIPLVLAAGYRQPALLAKMAATLDDISGGRLVLGLGAGGSRDDHERSGVPWHPLAERVSRLEEGVRAIRRMWGAHGAAPDARRFGTLTAGSGFRAAREPGPPILIGGHDERHLLPAAARVADICNVGFDMSVGEWERTKRLLARHCLEAGRDPGSLALSHNATVIVARDAKAAEAGAQHLARARGWRPEEARKRLANALIGTPEACASRLGEYVASGVSWFFVLFTDLPDLGSLRLFAREVLPAVAGP